VAVLGELPAAANVNVTVVCPGEAAADARNVKVAGPNAGGARTAEVGVTVTPAGRPEGVTVTFAVGRQEPGASEALTAPAAPPPLRVRADGVAAGVKSAGTTFAVKVTVADIPRGSATRAVTVLDPAAIPAAARRVKATVRAGGSAGTWMVAGVAVSPAGRDGNVTVGVPV
jgi:hypothetical protein